MSKPPRFPSKHDLSEFTPELARLLANGRTLTLTVSSDSVTAVLSLPGSEAIVSTAKTYDKAMEQLTAEFDGRKYSGGSR